MMSNCMSLGRRGGQIINEALAGHVTNRSASGVHSCESCRPKISLTGWWRASE